MPSADEWPTIQQELSRKALDVLHRRVSDHDRKIITQRELWLICGAIYEVVEGLAKRDASALINEIYKECQP